MPDSREVPAISWRKTEVLRPGMDFKKGTLYVTIPATVNVIETKGKGKNMTQEIVEKDGLGCITSDAEQFQFTKDALKTIGFAYPTHVTIEPVQRWSPDSIEAYVNGKITSSDPTALYAALRNVYEEYVEFEREEYNDIMPLFIMGTYMFRLWKALGYIHFNGTAASGKSQNLRLLDALAFNTMWSSSMSSAALYRSLAGNPGTVCIDEAEGWEGERGEELRRILNAGYLDGSTVKRAEQGPDGTFTIASFESFGPKAIASINPLDAVIGSRCLIVSMRPALRTIREFDKDDPRWQKLRDRLYLWAMYHADGVSKKVSEWNESTRFERAPGLVSRAWQITQSYVTLADYLDSLDKGNRCDRMIAFFSEYFENLQKKQDATDKIRLLLRILPEVLRTKTADEGGWYHIKTIHEVMSQYIEEDAKEYYKTRTVTKHLDVLGFKKRRPHKRGSQVWLEPEAVRQEFRQRRVEPTEDDMAWFKGEVEYIPIEAPAYTASKPSDDIWSNADEEEIEWHSKT